LTGEADCEVYRAVGGDTWEVSEECCGWWGWLLFLTALLEQKIVISSKRRSVLLSVSIALRSLLRLLDWTHLFVLLVQLALVEDLVQYPAPFILGIPSDDCSGVELVKSLQDDVTLVNIDVGCMILAQRFAGDFGGKDGGLQVVVKLIAHALYLVEGLWTVLGSLQCEMVWCCDSPSLGTVGFGGGGGWDGVEEAIKKVEVLRSMTGEFIRELLTGSTICYFWMEGEAQPKPSQQNTVFSGDTSILFDEDRFFHLKTHSSSWEPSPKNTCLANRLKYPSNWSTPTPPRSHTTTTNSLSTANPPIPPLTPPPPRRKGGRTSDSASQDTPSSRLGTVRSWRRSWGARRCAV